MAFGVIAIGGVAAQDEITPPVDEIREIESVPPFALGDQYFSIAVGGYFPLLLINPEEGTSGPTNQIIGGTGALAWNIYLNSAFTVGVEIAYTFSNTPNDQLLSMVPIAIQIGFAPRFSQFILPIHLDVGAIFNFYKGSTKPDLLLRAGVGFYWFFDPSWAVGIETEYYLVPQIYTGEPAPAPDTRILNSITASIGVIYRL